MKTPTKTFAVAVTYVKMFTVKALDHDGAYRAAEKHFDRKMNKHFSTWYVLEVKE